MNDDDVIFEAENAEMDTIKAEVSRAIGHEVGTVEVHTWYSYEADGWGEDACDSFECDFDDIEWKISWMGIQPFTVHIFVENIVVEIWNYHQNYEYNKPEEVKIRKENQ